MTDREMLELAAKAAGISLDWPQDLGGADFLSPRNTTEWQLWNPLTSDGDALRLAASMSMETACDPVESHAPFAYARVRGTCDNYVFEPVVSDPCAALRRAIVRAAAEIGKQMP